MPRSTSANHWVEPVASDVARGSLRFTTRRPYVLIRGRANLDSCDRPAGEQVTGEDRTGGRPQELRDAYLVGTGLARPTGA